MPKKKDRWVPVRRVGKPDTKPRQLCQRDLLYSRAMSYPEEIEWYDQPAKTWRRMKVD